MARKGQFKKGGGRVGHASHSSGGRSRSKSRKSKSIVVRQAAPIVIRQSSSSPAKRHPKRHHSRHRGGGNDHSLTRRLKLAAIGGLLGYTVGEGAPSKLDILDKIPDIGKLPKEAVIAGIAYVGRRLHPLVNDLATVALIVAGNKLGKAGFKLSGYYDDE